MRARFNPAPETIERNETKQLVEAPEAFGKAIYLAFGEYG
jgi:hypothetical protein